jgi:hypothetical protein
MTVAYVLCKGEYHDADFKRMGQTWVCNQRDKCERYRQFHDRPTRLVTPVALYLCGESDRAVQQWQQRLHEEQPQESQGVPQHEADELFGDVQVMEAQALAAMPGKRH